MGCCCCCVSGRKARRSRAPGLYPRPEEPVGPGIPPPPYDDKYNERSADGNSDISVALPKWQEKNSPASTPYEGHRSRVGVRSTDHRLYQAAAGGHLTEVKKLLDSGFNPSDRTVCDWCPLHWAAHNDLVHGHQIVTLLIEHGADINQVSDTGLTPLDLARRAKRTDNVKFLEKIGAQTGAQMRATEM